MPHMANLPWLQNYLFLILIFLLMTKTMFFLKSHPIKLNNKNSNSLSQKWTW